MNDERAESIACKATQKMTRPYLHDEIAAILKENGNAWMTTREVAKLVNVRDRYRKRDGSQVTDYQIHGRTRNRPEMFEREGSKLRLVCF